MFDAQKADELEEVEEAAPPSGEILTEIDSGGLFEVDKPGKKQAEVKKKTPKLQSDEIDDDWDFGDDDASMLDLISSYGQEDIRQKDVPVFKPKGKKK